MLVRKAGAAEEKTKWTVWLYHQCGQPIHMTDGMTMVSLYATVLQKINVAMDHLCQIALNENCAKETVWNKFQAKISSSGLGFVSSCVRVIYWFFLVSHTSESYILVLP